MIGGIFGFITPPETSLHMASVSPRLLPRTGPLCLVSAQFLEG
jgi:hypothetical protein